MLNLPNRHLNCSSAVQYGSALPGRTDTYEQDSLLKRLLPDGLIVPW